MIIEAEMQKMTPMTHTQMNELKKFKGNDDF